LIQNHLLLFFFFVPDGKNAHECLGLGSSSCDLLCILYAETI
jgi:hypothetical protein